ncbi:MAG: glycosyltransferase family 2 protein [Clostridiaceae bacterium]|nr:glycosyltransferase family 2 protein [Clostridiaceae bacterium]
MKIALLIPFYNEEEQIPLTLKTVIPILESTRMDFELIMVDDGSRDRTWPVIEEACRRDTRLTGLRFSRNFGKEAAICAALDQADSDAVILMDGDLQHPPQHIPDMIRLWQEGFDIVEGVKSTRGKESLASRLNAKVFYGLFRRFSGYDLRNASDFKLLDRRVVEQWRRLGEHDTFFRGLSAWLGFKRTTFSFEVAARQTGGSKWSLYKLAALSMNAITGFSAMPLQFITFLGLILLTGSVVLAIQTLVNWFTGQAASGFTTVILLLLLIGGSIMLSLGLIGIYVARIFTEVKGRPRYIIAESAQTRKTGSDLTDPS